MPIAFDDAGAILRAAHTHASHLGIAVCAVVADEGGTIQALGRMDEASPVSVDVAISKAVNASIMRLDGSAIVAIQRDRPGDLETLSQSVPRPMVVGLGARLISKDGRFMGALGISGASAEQDEECALAGLKALTQDLR
jgi:uncharacterized protein GlcG (DUF336 family)